MSTLLIKDPPLLIFSCYLVIQEEAELGVVMDNMSAGQELLKQKEDRLRVLENALLGGMVSRYLCSYSVHPC